MNSGRLWRWSPDKESLVTLSRSLKDLSCSQLCRYPALYLYLMLRSAAFQNAAATGSSVDPNGSSVLPNGPSVPPNNSCLDPQPYRGSCRPRFLAVRILPFSRISAAFRVRQDTSQSARGLIGLTDLTVPYHNLLLLSNTCL
jgi:hypothetical protein